MSEHQGQGWPIGTPAGGAPPLPRGWQPPAPAGPQGWQPPAPAGPQGWQPPAPAGPQGWQQPAPAGGWQQQAPTNAPWQQYPPTGGGWQPGPAPTGQPGWQGEQPPTQGFPPQSPPGGPGQPWTGQQPPVPPPAKNRTPVLITAIAVVIALIVAAGVYFFAIRDTRSGATGQDTPQESVTALFTTLGNSDPIGLADQLDPVEAKLFTDLNSDILGELKRLNVLSSAASTDTLTGTTISVSGITMDGANETINDNVQIVKLTGGTITVSSDPNSIPLSDSFKQAVGAEIDQAQPQSQTINIADAVAENNGDPIRIATVKRDGKWYVSLFYSIADNAAHSAGLPSPTAADQIPAEGKGSPEDAAQAFIAAATAGNVEDVIKVLPPD
jgi:hypothetical protein